MDIARLPQIGFGTWPLKAEVARASVETALEVGYRHIDTAQMYANEAEVGAALAASGLPPDEVFLTTKVDPSNGSPRRLVDSVRRSLEQLQRDRVDLLLLHWPPRGEPVEGQLDALAAAQDQGLTREIGVSNFTRPLLRLAVDRLGARIAANQVEFHPLLDQTPLLSESRQLGVPLVAYSPLARGKALEVPEVKRVAQARARPPSQIVLRWILQQGVKLVVMTTNRSRAIEDLGALEFELTDAEMRAVGSEIGRNVRVVSPAQWAPDWD